MNTYRKIGVGLASVSLLAACGRDGEVDNGPQGRLSVKTSALTLEGVVDAEYTLAVYNADDQLVWEKAGVKASRYGAPGGSLSYIGTCDADSNLNRVELTMTALYDTPTHQIPANRWQNPTAFGPLVREVECVENADAFVEFDLTIMRPAEQGFFDIGVTFSDIFCSAKVDCKDELLHNAEGERDATVVMALACTSGEGDPTWLHYSDVALKCGDVVTWLDPSVGPGQVGGQGTSIFEVATYRGQEALPDVDKCYWNMAIGLNLGADAEDCSLIAYATASHEAFGAEGATPENAVYPYVAFEVPLTGGTGEFICGSHPLNGSPVGVTTGYTENNGTRFPYEWECDETTTITNERVLCSGSVLAGTGAVAFTQSPGGVRFSVGDRATELIGLSGNRRLKGCCSNPCPDCQPVIGD